MDNNEQIFLINKLKTMFKLIEAYPAFLFLMIPLIIFLYVSVKKNLQQMEKF